MSFAEEITIRSLVSDAGVNTETGISGANWSGNTYTGAGEQNQYHYVTVSLQTDEAGTLFLDFSVDGTNWSTFPVVGFDIVSGIHEYHSAHKAGRYFRPRFVGSGGRTYFRLYTYYSHTPVQLNTPLNQSIGGDSDAITTKAILAGQRSDGTYSNIRMDDKNALTVSSGSTVATFGDLVSSNRTDQIKVNFANTTPDILVDTTTAGSGTVTNANAQSVVASGITASSTAQMQTRRTVNYTPSHELYAYFTATFSDPTANGEQMIGLFDDNNGFAIGYVGTDFCIRRRDNGTDTDVVLANFNGTLDSDFTRDGTVETLDPTLGNVYRIRFGWLGNAPIRYEVLAPDGNWLAMHTVKYPNTATTASTQDPDLPLRSYVSNGADTTNVSIATSSWAAGEIKVPSGTDVIFQRTNSKDGTVPTGGAPTIDPVFNNDANVLDSGWIRTIDFPGGNFLNIISDVGVNVYLMNASDDQGANIVGNGVPTIQTTANVPATIAAPYFDDYYRILISNESGSTMSSYTIHNRGHAEAQQNLYLGLEQTLLGFFTAQLDRSVIAGKTDAGLYGNVTRGDSGGLRVSINEHEVETPIKPLVNYQTNQANVGTTAVQIVGSPLTGRKSVLVKNLSDSTKVVFIGNSSSVTTSNGYELAAGEGITIEIDDTGDAIWAIAASGTQRVCWLEIGE